VGHRNVQKIIIIFIYKIDKDFIKKGKQIKMFLYLKIGAVLIAIALTLISVKTLQNYAVLKQKYSEQQLLIESMKNEQKKRDIIISETQKNIDTNKFKGNEYVNGMREKGYVNSDSFDGWLRAYEFDSTKTTDSR